jgi:hypothetical protein
MCLVKFIINSVFIFQEVRIATFKVIYIVTVVSFLMRRLHTDVTSKYGLLIVHGVMMEICVRTTEPQVAFKVYMAIEKLRRCESLGI